MSSFRQLFRYNLQVWRKTKSLFWFKTIKYFGIPDSDIRWDSDTSAVTIISLNVALLHPSHKFLLEAYILLKELVSDLGVELCQEDREILLKYQDLRIPIESREEVFIFHEVFHEGFYNLASNNDSVVVDIGFNIGIASLFFARRDSVEKVYAFEPLAPTLEKGRKVLARNPSLASKIEVSNFGLSASDDELEVLYDYTHKGNVGLKGQKMSHATRKEKIEIRDCQPIFEEIISSHPDKLIIVKMDCEGSEYAIVKRLEESGLLGRIGFCVIEFHFEGADKIRESLMRSNFDCIVLNEKQPIGLIYAWKR